MPASTIPPYLSLIPTTSLASGRQVRAPEGFAIALDQIARGPELPPDSGELTASSARSDEDESRSDDRETVARDDDAIHAEPAEDSSSVDGNELTSDSEQDTVTVSDAAVKLASEVDVSDASRETEITSRHQTLQASVNATSAAVDSNAANKKAAAETEAQVLVAGQTDALPSTPAVLKVGMQEVATAEGDNEVKQPSAVPQSDSMDAVVAASSNGQQSEAIAGASSGASVAPPQTSATAAAVKAEEEAATKPDPTQSGEKARASEELSAGVRPVETSADEALVVEQLKTAVELPEDSQVSEFRDKPSATTQPAPSPLHRTTVSSGRSLEQADPPPVDTSRVDPSKFIGRVTRAFQAAEQRGGTVQLRLSPPELGAMKIELTTQQGVMTAKLETETAAAKNVLLDNLPALRERLAAQEIRIDRFEVDVRQQGSGGEPDWQAQQEGRDARSRHMHRPGRPQQASGSGAPKVPEAVTKPNLSHNGQFSAVA